MRTASVLACLVFLACATEVAMKNEEKIEPEVPMVGPDYYDVRIGETEIGDVMEGETSPWFLTEPGEQPVYVNDLEDPIYLATLTAGEKNLVTIASDWQITVTIE